jgi:hypothetical protein
LLEKTPNSKYNISKRRINVHPKTGCLWEKPGKSLMFDRGLKGKDFYVNGTLNRLLLGETPLSICKPSMFMLGFLTTLKQ